ncbi:hypothetical protein GF406_25805 [candidate division KSB1 bacterium]|nr:hypothetical protein [candidate division KSB1 bacterium]
MNRNTMFTLLVSFSLSFLFGFFSPLWTDPACASPLQEQQKEEKIPKEFLQTPEEYFQTEVSKLITIQDPSDVRRLRTKLITLLWGNPVLPSEGVDSVMQNYTDERYADIQSLKSISKMVVKMEFGLESHIYHFNPTVPKNHIVIYHQGHRGDFIKSKEQIGFFLDHGYPVVAFCMPLLGLNNQPTVYLERFGYLEMTTHDHLKMLNPQAGHPVKFFVEPIIRTLNYLLESGHSSFSMVGISGGGWTTTLVAALDPRILKSFPVAGTYPIYLRSNSQRDWGDYEQNAPAIYRTVNYPELYILGSFGENRKQLQILNQFDSCCFAGPKWETYKDVVRQRVFTLGQGEFDLFSDDSHYEHMISGPVMTLILGELQTIHIK